MMRSTFAGFTTATLALNASHRALEVTGQNIANVNTEGYTRQRLDLTSLYYRGGEFYNSNPNARIGFGVDITGVSQLRDPFLDAQYRMQMAKLGTTDSHVSGYEKLSDIIDNTDRTQIEAAFRDVMTQLQALQSNTNSKEYDSMVRSSCQSLLNLFHQTATDLKDTRNDLTTEYMDTTIKDANEILRNIAELNETIKNSEILGNNALELRDERNLLIDELSSYLPINTDYWDKDIGGGVTVEILDIYYTTADGSRVKLVGDNRYGSLTGTVKDDGSVGLAVTGSDREYDGYDITEDIQDGVLKGTIDILNKSGNFDAPPTDVRGIGYYEKSFDALVAKFAEVFNDLNQVVKRDADGNPQRIPLLDGNGDQIVDVNGELQWQVDADGEYVYEMEERPLFETADGSEDFTAANIIIAKDWETGEYGVTTSTIAVAGGEGDTIGSTASDNVLKMIEALNATQEFQVDDTTFYKGSFYNCFVNMENVLNIDLKAESNTLDNKITVINQTTDLRDAVSAVSLDEEGISLLHYQQSYSAAARLMTTLDEALDKLINGTGVVGR